MEKTTTNIEMVHGRSDGSSPWRLCGLSKRGAHSGGAHLLLAPIWYSPPAGGEKSQLQSEASQRQEKSLQLFAQAFAKEEMAAMSAIGEAIRNAEHEQQTVAAIPTWPWPPGLLRGTMTAVFLPLIIWAATRILERFFSP